MNESDAETDQGEQSENKKKGLTSFSQFSILVSIVKVGRDFFAHSLIQMSVPILDA